jgi:hypothetical protein
MRKLLAVSVVVIATAGLAACGNSRTDRTLAGAAIGGAVGGVVGGVTTGNPWGVGIGAATGAAVGGVIGGITAPRGNGCRGDDCY